MSNVHYIVNKETGVVQAILDRTRNDAIGTIIKATSDEGVCFDKRYYIHDSYKGKSRCNFSDGDVFDEEDGKKRALKRLMIKINTARAKAIARYLADKKAEQEVLSERLAVINERLVADFEVRPVRKVVEAANLDKAVGNVKVASSIGKDMVNKMIETYEKSIG